MNITIRDEAKRVEASMELFLWKEKRSDSVYLKGKDASGNTWSIMEITNSGVRLMTGIPSHTGWPIKLVSNTTGTIKVR